MTLVENILEKPKHYRKKVAYAATGLIGVLIFAAWIVIAGNSVRQAISPNQQNGNEKNTADTSPSLRQETLKTKLIEQNENQDPQQQQADTQNETFETLLKKQNQANPNQKIIERP